MANVNVDATNIITVNVPFSEIEEFLDPLGFHTRAKYLYKIRTKAGGDPVFYTPWKPQQILDRIIREEFQRSKEVLDFHQVFLMYLKSRQEGLSTDTTLRMIDKMLFNDSYFAQVLAHDDEGTGLLYTQYKRAFENLPHKVVVVNGDGQPVIDGGSTWEIPIRPAGGPTKRGITFKDLSKSSLIVQTAGKGDSAGKAGSLNAVHYSENANYREHDDVISSVNQMLGGDDIFGVKESTANGTTGVGEGFYNDWVAEEKSWLRFQSGENITYEGWRPVFLPWYWLYHKPLYKDQKVSLDGIEWESEKEKQNYLEWEEKVEEEIIPQDPEIDETERDPREYTNFYRDVIKKKCQRKLSNARRYYPTTPQEAFVTSDRCFFSTNKLITVELNLKSHADNSLGYKTGELNEDLEFIERAGGNFKIKTFPEPNWDYRYVISCDQSEGYEDGDYSDMSVFDRVTRDFVAYWNGLISENELAKLFTWIGYFYGNGLLIPERNKTTVINLIKPDGYERYMGDIYHEIAGSSTNRREPNWGHHTNHVSRKKIIDKLESFLNGEENFAHDPEIGNYDKLFTLEQINEYKHFIRDANGKISRYGAASGYKDDIVIGDGLCLIGDQWWDRSPQKRVRTRKSGIVNVSTSTRARSYGKSNQRQSQLGKRSSNGSDKFKLRVGKGRRQSRLGK